jgi:hypothetical protein
MSKIHDLIANADDKTMVDFRRGSQIDSVPIEDLRAIITKPDDEEPEAYQGHEPSLRGVGGG